MRKQISAAIAAAILTASLTGCTNTENVSNSSSIPWEFITTMDRDASAVITVNGSWANFQALEAAAADWNAIYPNVEINYVKIDNYNAMISKLVSGENPPELIMFDVASYYEDKNTIISSLEDLSNIDLDFSVVNSSAIAAETSDGKLCSLPWGVLSTGFVANTTLLDSLGLQIPKTHEEFNQVCEALIANGYTPIQGCTDGFYKNIINNDMKYRLAQLDQQELIDSFSPAADGCGEIFTEEFTTMLELVDNGFVSSEINNSISDNYEGNIMHFFEGNTPFLCFTTEGFSGMKKRESKSEKFSATPFEYEFVSLPVSSEQPTLSMSFLPGLSLVSGSENEKWAKEFLRFVCSTKELAQMASVKSVPSITTYASDDERYSNISAIPEEMKVVPYIDDRTALVDETFAFTLQNIGEGTISSVDDACAYFEQRLKSFD